MASERLISVPSQAYVERLEGDVEGLYAMVEHLRSALVVLASEVYAGDRSALNDPFYVRTDHVRTLLDWGLKEDGTT